LSRRWAPAVWQVTGGQRRWSSTTSGCCTTASTARRGRRLPAAEPADLS
jgi:hypothetical protein